MCFGQETEKPGRGAPASVLIRSHGQEPADKRCSALGFYPENFARQGLLASFRSERNGPLTTTYNSNVFNGGAIPIGDAKWYLNTFNNVLLIVNALPADIGGNNYQNCRIEFVPGGVTPAEFADWAEPKE